MFKIKSEFLKNVLTLATGTSIAQGIVIGVSPILTRFYTPEDFGVLSIFSSIVIILGTMSTGQFEQAIILPQSQKEGIAITLMSLITSFIVSIIILCIILFFHNSISHWLGNDKIGNWLYFVPFSIFIIGIYNSLNYFSIRSKSYKTIAGAEVSKSISLATSQSIFGFMSMGHAGLIIGQILSYLSGNYKLLKNFIAKKKETEQISWNEIKFQGIKYKRFPMFSMPAILANSMSRNFGNILIGIIFSKSILGFYSLAFKVLGLPITLIGGNIGKVFLQKANEDKINNGNTVDIFLKIFKKLVLIGFPLFLVLFFILEDTFAFVYGETWRVAGIYSKILVPLFFLRFVSSTLSPVVSIFEKQHIMLIINIILLTTLLIIVFFIKFFNCEFLIFIKLLSGIYSFEYLLFIYVYYKISLGSKN